MRSMYRTYLLIHCSDISPNMYTPSVSTCPGHGVGWNTSWGKLKQSIKHRVMSCQKNKNVLKQTLLQHVAANNNDYIKANISPNMYTLSVSTCPGHGGRLKHVILLFRLLGFAIVMGSPNAAFGFIFWRTRADYVFCQSVFDRRSG